MWSVFKLVAQSAIPRSARVVALCAVLSALAGHTVAEPTVTQKGTARSSKTEITRVERPQTLLQKALAKLPPQQAGKVDIYTIGIAGWAEQDVFVKELDGALVALASVLPVKDRALRLINNPETVKTAPLATRRNFADAVNGIAQIMDRDEDVLILLMTSHGGTPGLALSLPDGRQSVLSPREVKAVLDKAGIKNRVVIVSACYSGVFVKPLANDNSIVLTAADETHPSFGCTAGREWTYFGDALFNQHLKPGNDFKRAFDRARVMIAGWERMDNLTPSNPQGHFGPTLVDKLAPVFDAMARQ